MSINFLIYWFYLSIYILLITFWFSCYIYLIYIVLSLCSVLSFILIDVIHLLKILINESKSFIPVSQRVYHVYGIERELFELENQLYCFVHCEKIVGCCYYQTILSSHDIAFIVHFLFLLKYIFYGVFTKRKKFIIALFQYTSDY